MDFLSKLFSTDFMPHVYCLRLPEVIWLYVVANVAIAIAYFCIPPMLAFIIVKRRDLAFSWMVFLFGLFILACGTTHILDVVTLWHPVYRLDVVVRLITACASIGTAVLLVRIIPAVLALPNPQQLRDEISMRSAAQRELETLNQQLEKRVLERTATLNASNANLETAITELRYQLEINRAITTQAGDSILCTDQAGNLSFINPEVQRTFGYTSEELLGRNLHEALHVAPATSMLSAAASGLEDCKLHSATLHGDFLRDWSTEFYRKDGAAVQVACSAGPVEVNGKRAGSVIIARDVTQRVKAEKALKESELLYRTLVEAMPQLVWSARSDGYVDYFSSQWMNYTGTADLDSFGSQWQTAIHPYDWEATKQGWQSSLLSGELYEMEHRLRRYDGTWRWFKSRAVPLLSEGAPIRWLGTSTDIDADKRATAVLEQFNADLQNLASAMAHDLHEPLRAIVIQAQLLSKHIGDQLDADAAAILGRVIDGANHMRRLLRDITIYSETITRPFAIEPVDLAELLQGVLQAERKKWEAHDIALHVEVEPNCLVEVDVPSLRLVFRQLLENALTYRRPDCDLRITISAQFYEGEYIVAFSDNGIGIKPEYYERIFQLFKRLHNQEVHPGTGVGLAMCQKILQRHSKKMWVRSNPEGGAVFFFSLQSTSRIGEGMIVAHAPAAG